MKRTITLILTILLASSVFALPPTSGKPGFVTSIGAVQGIDDVTVMQLPPNTKGDAIDVIDDSGDDHGWGGEQRVGPNPPPQNEPQDGWMGWIKFITFLKKTFYWF